MSCYVYDVGGVPHNADPVAVAEALARFMIESGVSGVSANVGGKRYVLRIVEEV